MFLIKSLHQRTLGTIAICSLLFIACQNPKTTEVPETSGNPIFEGWYADPEGVVFGDEYWVFPTYSNRYKQQIFFDAFSSKDRDHRVTSIDKMKFNADGTIRPIKMTFEGVEARPIK